MTENPLTLPEATSGTATPSCAATDVSDKSLPSPVLAVPEDGPGALPAPLSNTTIAGDGYNIEPTTTSPPNAASQGGAPPAQTVV